MTTPQKIVDRLIHFTVEAYNDSYDSVKIQKLRHDYECALGKAIQMYKEANEDIRPEVKRYNELILKIKMIFQHNCCETVEEILALDEKLRASNKACPDAPVQNHPYEIVDRLLYLTAEAYNDAPSSKAQQKLKHDYECAIEDAVEIYKKSYYKMRQESVRYNEFREKVKQFFGQNDCEHVERILTWDEDLHDGISIRRSHGYIK
ncbi:hypothetical protein [Halobacillus campisalis]|uniref:Uncharacterized protein n=1 Tax=Halobacillus campisalis TaxID=435909 RepID=A0ABW2K1N6_9BACI|nr:hypothetical protein [Halobacillus campisalis]